MHALSNFIVGYHDMHVIAALLIVESFTHTRTFGKCGSGKCSILSDWENNDPSPSVKPLNSTLLNRSDLNNVPTPGVGLGPQHLQVDAGEEVHHKDREMSLNGAEISGLSWKRKGRNMLLHVKSYTRQKDWRQTQVSKASHAGAR